MQHLEILEYFLLIFSIQAHESALEIDRVFVDLVWDLENWKFNTKTFIDSSDITL